MRTARPSFHSPTRRPGVKRACCSSYVSRRSPTKRHHRQATPPETCHSQCSESSSCSRTIGSNDTDASDDDSGDSESSSSDSSSDESSNVGDDVSSSSSDEQACKTGEDRCVKCMLEYLEYIKDELHVFQDKVDACIKITRHLCVKTGHM